MQHDALLDGLGGALRGAETVAGGVCAAHERLLVDVRLGALTIGGIVVAWVLATACTTWLRLTHASNKRGYSSDRGRSHVEVRRSGRGLDAVAAVEDANLRHRAWLAYHSAGKGKAYQQARRAAEQHLLSSQGRCLESVQRMRQEVCEQLERADLRLGDTVSTADEQDDDVDVLPVDVAALRRKCAAQLAPGLGLRSGPKSPTVTPRRLCAGGIEGSTARRPLQFSARFSRTTQTDPTEYWLCKYALVHQQEFEALVNDSQLNSEISIPGVQGPLECAPLERLGSDLSQLRRSLDNFNATRSQLYQQPPPTEDVVVGCSTDEEPDNTEMQGRGMHASSMVSPTPVKSVLPSGLQPRWSPPVSPMESPGGSATASTTKSPVEAPSRAAQPNVLF